MSNSNGSMNAAAATTTVDRTYATALLQMAQASDQVDEIADEVAQLDSLLAEQADLRRLLNCGTLSTSEVSSIVDRVFNGRLSETVYRFLQVVNNKGRLASLQGICRAFDDLVDEQRGIIEVDVYVAQRLDDAEQARVSDAIGAALGKQIALHQYIDESLIGGLKIRIGDELIDASVATRLDQMKHNLIERGREKAREQSA